MTSPARPSAAARVLLVGLRGYRRLSVMTAPRCRFAPTCSHYAVDAVMAHGAARGGWLALRRVVRCHPFNPGGVDHVPGTQPTGADGVAQGARS